MAKYTATLTVAISAEIAEEIYQAALEDGVGPSVMGRKLIEEGLAARRFNDVLGGHVDREALRRAAAIFQIPEYSVLSVIIIASNQCPANENIFLEGIKYAGPIAAAMGWTLRKTAMRLADLYLEGYSGPSAGAKLHQLIALGVEE